VLIVERWILSRLRNMQFSSVEVLNAAIAELLVDLNDRPMRRIGRSRRDLFEGIERSALTPEAFEYAVWFVCPARSCVSFVCVAACPLPIHSKIDRVP